MAFSDYKITTWTQPVVNEADRPKRSAQEMKAVFDSNSNQLKTAFNGLIDALSASGSAGEIKLNDGKSVEEAVNGVSTALEAAVSNLSAAIEASITTCKQYTDDAVFASGAADMRKAVYDPNNVGADIYEYADGKNSGTLTKTIAASAWTGDAAPYVARVSFNIMGMRQNGFLAVAQEATAEQREAARAALLSVTGRTPASGNYLTITADGDKPTVDIPVTLIMLA